MTSNRAPRNNAEPRIKTHVTLEPGVVRALQHTAAADDRSVSYTVNRILKENLIGNRNRRSA